MTGDDIKTLRAQLGLTQAELAARLNEADPNLRIVPTSVSRWENGRHAPSRHVVAALEQVADKYGQNESGAERDG